MPEPMAAPLLASGELVQLHLQEIIPSRSICLVYDHHRPLNTAAVSYTHLDVYKRQGGGTLRLVEFQPETVFCGVDGSLLLGLMIPGAGSDPQRLGQRRNCLLYTSSMRVSSCSAATRFARPSL